MRLNEEMIWMSVRTPAESSPRTLVEGQRLDQPTFHALYVEISHTSRYTDLGPKFEDYERVGVLEYIVRAIDPDEIHWFVLRKGRFVDLEPGADGIYRSEVFPGLWLDPDALLASDTRRLRAVVELGCATPDHAAFVAKLAVARGTA
jgi:hypothetical protein